MFFMRNKKNYLSIFVKKILLYLELCQFMINMGYFSCFFSINNMLWPSIRIESPQRSISIEVSP